MVKKIPLQNGMFALVDDEDYERCMARVWTANMQKNGSLSVYSAGTRKDKLPKENLRYFILGIKYQKGMIVCHLDGNGYNFQKSNLLLSPVKGSSKNRKGASGSSSRYRGVARNKNGKSWRAQINVGGSVKYLGSFSSEDEAAKVYNENARFYWGENSFQNTIGEDNNSSELDLDLGSQKRTREKSKTGFRGVKRVDKTNPERYGAYIGHENGGWLGSYDTPFEAAIVYDLKAKELFGDKAILNFPEIGLDIQGELLSQEIYREAYALTEDQASQLADILEGAE